MNWIEGASENIVVFGPVVWIATKEGVFRFQPEPDLAAGIATQVRSNELGPETLAA